MELCTSRAIFKSPHHKLFCPRNFQSMLLKKSTISYEFPGLLYSATPLLRASISEEISSSIKQQSEDVPGGIISMEGNQADEQNVPYEPITTTEVPKEVVPGGIISIEGNRADEQNVPYEPITTTEVPKEEVPMGEQMQVLEFLNNLNIKLDSEDTYSLLLYGSGAVVGLWIVSAIVGAIDSIPLIPKVLEIVGLFFTIWFSSRYLIFKKNRDELLATIEELKQEVLGSDGE